MATVCTLAGRLLTVEIKWADNPEKWAELCGLDNAYHGMVFAEALAQMGNVAYLIYVRTHWLRDAGGRVYESLCGVSIFTGH